MLRLNPNYETDFAPQLAKRRAALDAFDIASIATPAGPAVGPLRSDATAGLGRRQAEDRADYSHGGCRGCPRPPDWMLCMHRGYEYGYYWPEQNKPAEGDGDWSECLCHRYQADIPYTRRNIDYLMSVPGPATIEAGECQRVACMHNSGISWCNLVSLFFFSSSFLRRSRPKKGETRWLTTETGMIGQLELDHPHRLFLDCPRGERPPVQLRLALGLWRVVVYRRNPPPPRRTD